jgi:hypothetical protein
VAEFPTNVLPVSVKNVKFVADKLVVRRVDTVISVPTNVLAIILDAPMESNVTDGKRRVEAASVHVTASFITILETFILDADNVLTFSVDTAALSKRVLAT